MEAVAYVASIAPVVGDGRPRLRHTRHQQPARWPVARTAVPGGRCCSRLRYVITSFIIIIIAIIIDQFISVRRSGCPGCASPPLKASGGQASRRKRASRRPCPPAPALHTAGAEKRKDAVLAAAGGVRFSLCNKFIVYCYTEFII